MESLGSHPGYSDVRQWAWQPQPARLDAPAAAGLLETRQSQAAGSPFDGDLRALETE